MSKLLDARAIADRMVYRDELRAALDNVCSETLRRYMAGCSTNP